MEACTLLVNLRKGMQSSREQPLVGEERYVATRITAAKENTVPTVKITIARAFPCRHSTAVASNFNLGKIFVFSEIDDQELDVFVKSILELLPMQCHAGHTNHCSNF